MLAETKNSNKDVFAQLQSELNTADVEPKIRIKTLSESSEEPHPITEEVEVAKNKHCKRYIWTK